MPDETRTLRRMCWFLLIVIIGWFFVAIAVTMVIFYFTRNPFCLSFFPTLTSPVVGFLSWIIKPLLPMNEKRYRLAEKKIEMKMLKSVKPPKASDTGNQVVITSDY